MEIIENGSLDASAVQDYVCSVAHRLLNSDRKSLEGVLDENHGKFEEFVREGHAKRLVVRRNPPEEGKKHSFSVLSGVQSFGAKNSRGSLSVLFIKSFPTLVSGKPLAEQIYACQVKDVVPYEAMLNYIRHAFLPYSRFVMSSDKDGDKKDIDFNILRQVNSKLSELEVSLLRCQQNIEIPQIQLQV